MDALDGFTKNTFIAPNGKVLAYYGIGCGPPVLVLHEALGLSPSDLEFCRRIASDGFTVYAPVLFGNAGQSPNPLRRLRYFFHICFSREFAAFAKRHSSPIAGVLRALGRSIVARHPGSKLGVVGLCLTGNFALAMLADEYLVAPVVSEPALPFALSTKMRASIGLSDQEIKKVEHRVGEGIKILGFRFKPDRICPNERFESMRMLFGSGFEGHCINPSPKRGSHSVFTQDYDSEWEPTREAFNCLIAFLRERLMQNTDTT